jgi:hypothetical protein
MRMPAPIATVSHPPPPAAGEDDLVALERLAGPRDRGALSPEEFEREKRRIIGEG